MKINWKKIIGISGLTFVIALLVTKKKKNSSIYSGENEEKNSLEGCKVIFVPNETEELNADGERGHLEAIGKSDYIPSFYEKYVKRAFDVLLSFGGFVVLSPVFFVIAIAIYIEDPGPIFFTQKRIGKNKQFFKLHKFRSMKMNTPHDVPTHMLDNPEQYITKVGKFIREHSLDELPQIWDIFIGNMSVIGPRPALWNQDKLTAERDKYNANDVKPGLTGWAQINGRDELEIPEKAGLDGEYVRNLGFLMDARCFLRSIHVFGKDTSVIEGGTGEMKKNERKKIVVLSSHTPSLFWFRMDMMKDFQVHGYDVYALGNESEDKWKEKFEEYGIVYEQIVIERNGVNPLKDLQTLLSICSVLKRLSPDKIFTFQAKTVIYGGIAAKQLGIKEVYPLIAGMGSVFLKNDLKTKIIRKIMVQEYKYSMKNCPAVFFQNHDDEMIFRNNGIIKKQKIVLLPGSGVNCEKFTLQTMPEEFGFLCISRLIRDKGVYEYLEACRIIKQTHPNVRCLLVGPYDSNPSAISQEELKPYLKEGVVEYFGEQEDVRPFLKQCNVFILPSYREGTPKTNLEAMASGRAIITTDAPGCKETVVDKSNGFIVPVKNIKAIVEKMEIFIANPNLASEMGKAGRTMVEKKFDVKLVNEMINNTMQLN